MVRVSIIKKYHITWRHILAFLLVSPKYLPTVFFRSIVGLLLIALGLGRSREFFDERLPKPAYGCPLRGSLAYLHIPFGLRLISWWEKEASETLYENLISRIYERFFRIRSEDIVTDVGAHVGAFALGAAKKASRGRVVAFEPHPGNFQLLLRNIKLNRLTNVVPIKACCGSVSGKAGLSIGPWSATHALTTKTDSSGVIEVTVRTLDEVVNELKLPYVSVIKIDAEGSELEVLKGAQLILTRHSPKLSIAAYHTPSEAHEISKFLSSMGFMVQVRDGYVYAVKSFHEMISDSWNSSIEKVDREILFFIETDRLPIRSWFKELSIFT